MSSHQSERDQLDGPPATKRRRIALSCIDCRKRKLKCDREYPICSRCREGRHPERCTYDPNAVEEIISKPIPTNGTTNGTVSSKDDNLSPIKVTSSGVRHQTFNGPKSTGVLESRIEQLENRIIGLERIINLSGKVEDPLSRARLHSRSTWNEISGHEFLEFRGKGCGTHFHGGSHPQSYLSQMPALRVFVREMIVQHPRAKQVRDQLKRSKFKRPKTRSAFIDHKALLALLPEKDIVNHYVKLYADSFEHTYRVLHMPSFWSEYEKLWEASHEIEAMFVVHVILMVAAMYCMPGNGNTDGVGINRDLLPAAQDTACYWIEECESWLEAQSQKHSTLAYMQAHCLLFIAKTMQSFKIKRSWTAAGTLMSFALTKGFHRNSEIVNRQQGDDPKIRVSRFSQEMRRRLWSTIVELEMQAALERGMPALLPDLISDCGPPCNCDDEALSPGVERELIPSPDTVFSRTSYQCEASKSLRLRQQVLCIINGTTQPSQSEFLDIHNDLINHLDNIPSWDSSPNTNNNDSTTIIPSALLKLQFYELIMFLHRTPTQDQKNGWSSTLHIKAARSILETHQNLITNHHSFLTVLRNDVASAALAICYDFESTKSLRQNNLFISSSENDDHLTHLATALSILEKKIDWMGMGMKAYYIIAACEGLVRRSKGYAGNQEASAAEKVTGIMERMVRRYSDSKDVSMAHSLSNGGSSTTTAIEHDASNANDVNGSLLMNPAQIGDFSFDLQDWDLNAFLNF